MAENCCRCGEAGEDRRTLWMACSYRMDELPIPFEQVLLTGDSWAYKGERPSALSGITVPQWGTEPVSTDGRRAFYTLRVCKPCRSDWMASVREWFQSPPRRLRTGTGVYVREDGASRELTEAEVLDRWPVEAGDAT